jgi:peptide deformylase
MTAIELKIRTFGDPVLRKKSRRVDKVSNRHRDILQEMARTMYELSGIGLAAPQVGISENLIVVDAGSGLYKLINPKIVKKEGSQSLEEGCLSVPGVCIKVKRAKAVIVEALDEDGKQISIEAQGLLACVFQHEIDHLLGKLIADYASVFQRLKINRRLEELKGRYYNEALPKSKEQHCKLQL